MAIRYTTAESARLATLHKLAEKNLCLGYATWSWDGIVEMETLYAVKADGEVLTSTHRKTNEFDNGARRWVVCRNTVPEGAEFIGSYPVPPRVKTVRKQSQNLFFREIAVGQDFWMDGKIWRKTDDQGAESETTTRAIEPDEVVIA